MVVKVKEKVEKTRHVENIDESKKFILRGQRNVRYHDRILFKKRNLIISLESILRNKILQKLYWPIF